MSWDADLIDDRGHEGSWNYTHNTNRMIAAALESQGEPEVPECEGPLGKAIGPAWWDQLNGKSGAEGAAFIDRIITGLRSDPDRFEAMNPPNGWGSYESLLEVLTQMRDAVPEWPAEWLVSG